MSFRASHSLGITTILRAKIWRGFSSLTLQWGGTPTIFDPIANSFSAKTFTWANTPGHGNYFTCTAHGYNQGVAVRLTTTGTLPNGGSPALATGTTYWVIPVDANTLLINPYPLTATAGDYTIYPTGAGSGTNTMTPYNYVCHFGSAWVATTSGRYVYVQGGGSIASDPTLQIQYDIPYELATKTLPPWDQTIGTVSSMAATHWAPQAFLANLQPYIGAAGDRADIGLFNQWQATHLYTQAIQDEINVRVIGLAQGNYSSCIRDVSTYGPVNLSLNSYTGMPASVASTFSWSPNSGSSGGFTAPGGTAGVFWCAVLTSARTTAIRRTTRPMPI